MLHLFCFLYHFQGIQPESGQKNEKSGITDSRTSQHLRADRMSGKEMKMPAKRQQPPLLHHSPKNGNSCHGKPNVNKKPCSKGIFCSYAAFPGIAFSRIKIHSAENGKLFGGHCRGRFTSLRAYLLIPNPRYPNLSPDDRTYRVSVLPYTCFRKVLPVPRRLENGSRNSQIA